MRNGAENGDRRAASGAAEDDDSKAFAGSNGHAPSQPELWGPDVSVIASGAAVAFQAAGAAESEGRPARAAEAASRRPRLIRRPTARSGIWGEHWDSLRPERYRAGDGDGGNGGGDEVGGGGAGVTAGDVQVCSDGGGGGGRGQGGEQAGGDAAPWPRGSAGDAGTTASPDNSTEADGAGEVAPREGVDLSVGDEPAAGRWEDDGGSRRGEKSPGRPGHRHHRRDRPRSRDGRADPEGGVGVDRNHDPSRRRERLTESAGREAPRSRDAGQAPETEGREMPPQAARRRSRGDRAGRSRTQHRLSWREEEEGGGDGVGNDSDGGGGNRQGGMERAGRQDDGGGSDGCGGGPGSDVQLLSPPDGERGGGGGDGASRDEGSGRPRRDRSGRRRESRRGEDSGDQAGGGVHTGHAAGTGHPPPVDDIERLFMRDLREILLESIAMVPMDRRPAPVEQPGTRQ